MLTCNAFSSNTVGTTQQVAACRAPHIANLEENQLLDEQFLLLVIDSLERLRTNPGTLPNLNTILPCDASDALRNASCAMKTNTPAFPLTVPQLQALILVQLNEGLCS
jgi:hypothetical protein